MKNQKLSGTTGLFIAQFFGAFNDNAWKLIVTLLAIRTISHPDPIQMEIASQAKTTLAFVCFTVPLILCSLPAAILADRISKQTMIVVLKAVEILLMGLAAIALWLEPTGGTLALIVLGLMGLQSAFFSPAKYGILPEILAHEQLSRGNAFLELWTLVAIIAGTACGGLFLDAVKKQIWLAGVILCIFSFLGWLAARTIPKVTPAKQADSSYRISKTIRDAWSAIRADRTLWLASLGLICFWTTASLLGQNLLIFAKNALALADQATGIPLAILAIGTGVGSIAAGKLSASKVELGLLPIGAGGLALFSMLLGLLNPSFPLAMVLLFLLGHCAGFLLIPLNALIQWKSPAMHRGAIIALTNVFVFGGMLLGSLGVDFVAKLGFASGQIFWLAGIVMIAGALWALWLVPTALLRFLLIILTHTFYRLKVVDRDRVPQTGGVLLVPNHVSFIDGLLIMASIDREVRFLIDASYFEHPLLRPFVKMLRAIPISAQGGPRVILRALKQAGKYLDAGEVVCIFPEGQISRTGMLNPFRRGMERIVKGKSVPVIPVHLDRLWGSIFSFSGGRFVGKMPERIPYPVTISFGKPLASDTPLHEIRAAVQELGDQAWMKRKNSSPTLHRAYIHSVRRRPWAFLFADTNSKRTSRLKSLIATIAIGRALRSSWQNQKHIGILLPPSVGAVITNLAASIAGHASVNLNYTAGVAGLASAVKQAQLQSVVTSEELLHKVKITLPDSVEKIDLEQILSRIGLGKKLCATFLALFSPAIGIEKYLGRKQANAVDEIVTIIFSSGSTGEPKGVQLTHFNILSNVQGMAQVFQVVARDRVLGILPFFHSFGYTATIWFSAIQGMGAVYYPNPVDAVAIGELVHRYRITMLLATPTFLQIYTRRVAPGQFGSLRLVLAGAEKLTERVATNFAERFGIRPLEGYGATECSPTIAVSSPGFRAPGFYQAGSKQGFLGQPLPGVAIRIVDPNTHKPLPPNEPGMILVRGPNVMQGYLGRDDLTKQVLQDGWYVTGDIGKLDEDGFLQITDRLARFSKIGGEMVPHGKVEEALHAAIHAQQQIFAVTSVMDEKKGEQLAVLHTLNPEKIPEVLQKLKESGLPNLFIPRASHFFAVKELPLLGTGKIDLRGVQKIVVEHLLK